MSPATKIVSISVSLGAIVVMMSSCTSAETLPDPRHCDKPGSPSYYSVGYSNGEAHPGTSYPSGHSSNYRDGWNAGAWRQDTQNKRRDKHGGKTWWSDVW